MDDKERKVYLKTRLRNLKRKHSKLAKHPDLTEEYFTIGREIASLEDEINLM